ncbi:MAG: inhibitor of KinA [Eubacteriales bacterium]|nr:inhibitor of KinA [Eubacteriales bacterium]
MSFPQIEPLGEIGAVIRLGEEIDPAVHSLVMAFAELLTKEPFPGLVECVPAYTTVTVFYDPVRVKLAEPAASPWQAVCSWLREAAGRIELGEKATSGKVVEIPVCYGGEFGPDLEFVATYHGLRPEEVIALHTGTGYRVYMLGFVPGFPYLGKLPARLVTPRRSSPRPQVPVGSVGIAGWQTGIYSFSTPGGWQIIGRTPLRLFRPEERPPVLLQPGDTVYFRAITPEEFAELTREKYES